MITRIARALAALLTFLVIAPDVMARFNSWECLCSNVECDECTNGAESESINSWDAMEWAEFEADAYWEYNDQFTALFNSYEVRFTKNGRTMIRRGDSGSFKFAKKG